MDLYTSRLDRLRKFIELRVPSEVIYFSAETLLLTKFNNSRWKLIWFLLREEWSNRWINITLDLEYWFYRTHMSKRSAQSKMLTRLTK